MEIYIPTPAKVLSQRKLEAYHTYSRIINEGRRNPIWFDEEMLGIKLMDYQKWSFMESWIRPYVLWLMCRGAGKTMEAAVYLGTRMILIPNYRVYISTLSAAQSIEVFKKIEDIAKQRIPSLQTITDILRMEVESTSGKTDGFVHDPGGHHFRMYNDSELITLSSNIDATRGKRGCVFYDECAWQSAIQLSTTENFTNVDSEFKLGVGKKRWIDPINMPLQLMYASSAGDASYPFYDKYRTFSKKMMLGDPNYFVCDLNANTIINFSSVDGEPIKSHLKQSNVDKQMEEDPDAARRELFNQFTTGGGEDAVVKMDTLIRNSVVRPPIYTNNTGKRKFILCYDPARAFDGSILGIFELREDKEKGLVLDLVNMISMVDPSTKNKTPLPMPEQVERIKKIMVDYNGDGCVDWENIELYIDAGPGGGGLSAVADSLLADWVDSYGKKHRGVIDATHKQYETSKRKYPHAVPIVHLVEPVSHKRLIYDAFEKMVKSDLISFPEYDGRDFLLLQDDKSSEPYEYKLSNEEVLSLTQCSLAKKELLYMCRSVTGNGNVTYELARDKRNTMHDDRAYVCALAAYALATKRRTKLITPVMEKKNLSAAFKIRKPKIY